MIKGLEIMEERARLVISGQSVPPVERGDEQIRQQPKQIVLETSKIVDCSVSLDCQANYHTIGCPALSR